MNDKQMDVMQHIGELRKRIFIVAIFFVVAIIAGMIVAKPLIVYFQSAPSHNYFAWLPFVDQAPVQQQLVLNAFRPTDAIYVFFEFAFIVGFVLTIPLLLYQIWAFISPGLYEHERRATLIYIPIMFLLFLVGIAFSYFILFPYAMHFMISLTANLEIEQTFGIHQYFTFLFQITLPFGLVFQLPVLATFLTRLGVITPQFLGKIRKYAYFVLLIIAGLITPPDVVSQLIVFTPLVGLYEISIVISRLAYRKIAKSEVVVRHE